MSADSTLKRVRVRLRATDRESLARAFGANLGIDSVFLTSCASLPLGTAVQVEISYATRTIALRGRGHVAWVREDAPNIPGGVAIAIAWDEESKATVEWALSRARQSSSPPPDDAPPALSFPPVAADLLLDGPTPTRGTPAIVFSDASEPGPPLSFEIRSIDAAPPVHAVPVDVASDLVLDDKPPSKPVAPAAPLPAAPAPMPATPAPDAVAALDANIPIITGTPDLPGPTSADLEDVFDAHFVTDPPDAPDPRTVSVTEYARFPADGSMKDELAAPTRLDALHSEDVIPKVPSATQWTDEQNVEWDRQSGEVTPLARIELVRRPSGFEVVPVDDEVSRDRDADDRFPDPVPSKSNKRRLPPRGDIVLGIDLGTTYSCAAIVEDGRGRVIPSRRGTTTIPSVVLIHPEGKTIVGEPASRKQPLFPSNTIVGVKRLIGRPFHSPIVQRARERYTYDIAEGDEGEAAVRIGEHRISLEEVSALILKEIRESASLNLGHRVNRAVITCPAYYNERQREAVRTAGELAGLHVERVLSEPTAAALNYGLGKGFSRKRLLVYDLGGGTFDASLMEVDGNVFSTLATGGDTFLGGIDFDACIVQLLVQNIRAHHKVDPREDRTAMAYLYQLAEQAKRDLSEQKAARVKMQHLTIAGSKPIALDVEVKRTVVEELFSPLVERTLELLAKVAARAKLELREVDDVILVGGQSRSPIIQRRLRELFGKDPRRDIHPDEAVAIGAAQYAAAMSTFDGLVLVDTLPISIGIGAPGGRFKRVIPQDTPLPVKRTHRIETTRDDQRELELVVFQGEDEDVANDELIGVLMLRELPPGARGEVAVNVSFEVDAESILRLRAVEEKTGREIAGEFISRGTPEEILTRLGTLDVPSMDLGVFGAGPGPVEHGGFMSWLKKTLTGSKRRAL